MLVINKNNLKFFTNRIDGVSTALERYPTTRLDVTDEVMHRLLRHDGLSRTQMLRNWTRLTPERVRGMDISTFSRSELIAVTRNPKISHLVFKEDVFRDTLTASYFNRCYDYLTVKEVMKYGIRLEQVISNMTVSLEVKQALIDKGLRSGTLPINDIDDLRRYLTIDLTPQELIELEAVKCDVPLIEESMLEHVLTKNSALMSACTALLACSGFSPDVVERILSLDNERALSHGFYTKLPAPDTVVQTKVIMERLQNSKAAIQYLAAKGMFDEESIGIMVEMIKRHGSPIDMICLYENVGLVPELRELVLPEISVSVEDGEFRSPIFDKLIINASDELLHEFCLTYKEDPVLMRVLQTPRAFKRTSLYCLEFVDGSAIDINEVITVCEGVEFTESDLDLIITQLVERCNDESVTRFLLLTGMSTEYKDELIKRIEDVRAKKS